MSTDEHYAERLAIFVESEGLEPGALSCLRISLGMWAADRTADLTPAQRLWIVERLDRDESLLSPAERHKLTPGLLAWAHARGTDLGRVLEECLGLRELETPGSRERDLAFVAGRVLGEEK